MNMMRKIFTDSQQNSEVENMELLAKFNGNLNRNNFP